MNVWKSWLYHLLSAGISGAASSVGACFVAPQDFNITSSAGWAHIGELAAFGFIVPVINILKDGLPPVTTATPQ
jgi:hypothetical protein